MKKFINGNENEINHFLNNMEIYQTKYNEEGIIDYCDLSVEDPNFALRLSNYFAEEIKIY